MTDDIIHSTQYYINYINRAILANETWQANSSTANTPTAIRNSVPMATHSSSGPTLMISIF